MREADLTEDEQDALVAIFLRGSDGRVLVGRVQRLLTHRLENLVGERDEAEATAEQMVRRLGEQIARAERAEAENARLRATVEAFKNATGCQCIGKPRRDAEGHPCEHVTGDGS